MFTELKKRVLKANLDLVKYNLVLFTWGNVSEKEGNYVAIKPSGISYDVLKYDDIVVLDLEGNIIDGIYNPSSDTPTHLELYKSFPEINGICHTHSNYATSFAQARKAIECFGTTHADYFYGTIPCTRELTEKETANNYEMNTGKVIVETFTDKDYRTIPGVLVNSHGVFSWGKNSADAVEKAVIIEELSKMNIYTLMLNPQNSSIPQYTLDKHFMRKHGSNAYYGQKSKMNEPLLEL